ncbi:hypothetical protein NS220_03530 [Microbacterium testaceum]|uniref:Uncharacterized protein n=1 Tax=Microbacterium testaceum TaxID=2033 RepID=A0A147F084_MICTE|nr:hypothetical protein [Microbacterium testaceum]KTR96026.1 hypothetical protein NS220_03530 [Microbacterium testaceum]
MNNASSSRRAAVAVVSVSVCLGLAIGAALWFGSQNLLMGATIGGILALLFGGFAVFTLRQAHPSQGGAGTDGGAAIVGGFGDGGCADGGGGGADGGGAC